MLFHDGLKVYGKQPEQLENATKLFMFALADYPIEKIVGALSYYARHYTEFPSPADIVQIIDRGNKPPLEKSVYIEICRKHADERTAAEWSYKREYEGFMIDG